MKRSTILGCLILLAGAMWISVGKIHLRGLVTTQARVQIASRLAPGGAIPLTSSPAAATGSVRLRFAELSAVPSGVDIVLESVNAETSQAPALVSNDGVTMPYRLVFNGRELVFSDGKADLGTITSNYKEDANGVELKAIAPPIPAATTEPISDEIVLNVVVR